MPRSRVGPLTVVTRRRRARASRRLAFDTLYAEGQRRYVASLSTYARQFLERLPRPEVDAITNLPPAIAIEQRNRVTNARSTVGTATEILDHLRLLFAQRRRDALLRAARCGPARWRRVTRARCSSASRASASRSALPLARRRGETPQALRERLLREGYTRLRLADGSVRRR